MGRIIAILSGEIGSGKSTLSESLRSVYDFTPFKTSALLESRLPEVARDKLQAEGALLDIETNGSWVVEEFIKKVGQSPQGFFVIDAVRIKNQINAFRSGFGISVIHIHLVAPKETLKERYLLRQSKGNKAADVGMNYEKVKADPTEQGVKLLEDVADLVIDTDCNQPKDVLIRVAAALNLTISTSKLAVDVIVGGQYGSEGKGQVVGYLAPEYSAILRSGGPNAGHTVFAEPFAHKFHHIPSGATRSQKAKLVLGPGMIIRVPKLLEEVAKYDLDNTRVFIDPNATIITDKDIADEKELVKLIGSTGQGVGAATVQNLLRVSDAHKAKHSPELKPYLQEASEVIERTLHEGGKILVEGTQGTGLSLYHGKYPKVTSRDTTASGVLAELGIGPRRVDRILMVIRSFPIRVGGNSGDFENTEISWEIVSKMSGISVDELKESEKTTTTNRQRRVAYFSWEQFHRACELNTPSDIVLNFSDYINIKNRDARRFEQLTDPTIQFIEGLQTVSGVDVSLIGTRFDYRSFIDRRRWAPTQNGHK